MFAGAADPEYAIARFDRHAVERRLICKDGGAVDDLKLIFDSARGGTCCEGRSPGCVGACVGLCEVACRTTGQKWFLIEYWAEHGADRVSSIACVLLRR